MTQTPVHGPKDAGAETIATNTEESNEIEEDPRLHVVNL
jgi:hypothetical protein